MWTQKQLTSNAFYSLFGTWELWTQKCSELRPSGFTYHRNDLIFHHSPSCQSLWISGGTGEPRTHWVGCAFTIITSLKLTACCENVNYFLTSFCSRELVYISIFPQKIRHASDNKWIMHNLSPLKENYDQSSFGHSALLWADPGSGGILTLMSGST